ncbi:MAG TPA: TIGR03118 family protein [Caldimonas sp.]|nr:TIGR03118 family protein [Caldimonas sp.]
MNTFRAAAGLIAVAAIGLSFAACGGGGYEAGSSPAGVVGTRYAATVLVVDAPTDSPGARIDAKLVNPWDLAFSAMSAVWVTNNGSSSSAIYADSDAPRQLLVSAPVRSAASARPTGVAFNSGNGFAVSENGRTGVARFIVASEGGTLSGWAPALGTETAVLAFDGSASGSAYTALAMTTVHGLDATLLAADFRNGRVDRFDVDFAKLGGADRFVDPQLPAGYAPYGILARNDLVHIAYALQDAQRRAAQAGAGRGLVNTFDSSGRLLKRLIPAGDVLDAPWGMAIAPANFGSFSGALLVANGGDGTINAFDPESGRWLGTLTQPNDAVLVIDGLHRIAFGNGAGGLPTHALFFAAGPDGGRHGTLGRIDAQ